LFLEGEAGGCDAIFGRGTHFPFEVDWACS
jgi:hypothetical protein